MLMDRSSWRLSNCRLRLTIRALLRGRLNWLNGDLSRDHLEVFLTQELSVRRWIEPLTGERTSTFCNGIRYEMLLPIKSSLMATICMNDFYISVPTKLLSLEDLSVQWEEDLLLSNDNSSLRLSRLPSLPRVEAICHL